ncbi:MAG: GNAT family N-acetyltransferase [Bryobacteraceae bacterium]
MQFRLASPSERPALEPLIVASFEPITWFKKVDARFGPLNGHDWRDRWRLRLDKVFASQIILAGEHEGAIAAVSTGAYESETRLGFIDLLAVSPSFQGHGFGREMLRAMVEHFRQLGARHVHLDCLTDNAKGMSLYGAEGWTPIAESMHWFLEIPDPAP